MDTIDKIDRTLNISGIVLGTVFFVLSICLIWLVEDIFRIPVVCMAISSYLFTFAPVISDSLGGKIIHQFFFLYFFESIVISIIALMVIGINANTVIYLVASGVVCIYSLRLLKRQKE